MQLCCPCMRWDSGDVWIKIRQGWENSNSIPSGFSVLGQKGFTKSLGCFPHPVSWLLTIFTVTCRSWTLCGVWHQGLLWSVCQHRHFPLECCCHQPPGWHGCPVHLRCSWCTHRPLHPDLGAIRPYWVYPALQPLVSRWVNRSYINLSCCVSCVVFLDYRVLCWSCFISQWANGRTYSAAVLQWL